MAAFVLLLRGVNVGGARRLPMKDLERAFESLGAQDVVTYKQSGNAVFTMKGRATTKALTNAIERAIEQIAAVTSPALVMSAGDFVAAANGNPFLARGADAKELHLTFLYEHPSPDLVRAFSAPPGERGEFELHGRSFYLRLPAGYSQSKLTNEYISRKLRVEATTRNWNTVTALAQLARQ